MRKLFAFGLVAMAALSSAQYPHMGVRMLSHIGLAGFPGQPTSGSAIYGYISPSGREYATVGLRNGVSIVDITNPTLPAVIAQIPGPNSLWHENVVLGDYDYSISDSTGAIGIQVIDLHNVDTGSATLVSTYTGNGLSNVHTIESDPVTRRLFANGSNRGFLVLDASNPTALQEVGRWTTKYVHDCAVRNYTSGPYAGKQIAFLCCGTNGLTIVDVTNPASITTLGSLIYYPGSAFAGKFYCHSASLTPDNHYLYINDEFDENKQITPSCTTTVIDVSNLSAPAVASVFRSGVNTIDHNSNLVNGFLYLSAYKGGLRVYDAANPLALHEVGFFDTYPSGTDAASYNGNWGVFARYPSGNVVLSDIDDGFFVVDPSEAIGQGAPLTAVSAPGGSIVSGGIKDLRYSDNGALTFTGPTRTVATLQVLAETSMAPRTAVQTTIEASGQCTVDLMLRNWSTGQYELIGTGTTGSADTVVNFPSVSSATYVNGSGQIDATVRFTMLTKTTPTIRPVDMVRFIVQ